MPDSELTGEEGSLAFDISGADSTGDVPAGVNAIGECTIVTPGDLAASFGDLASRPNAWFFYNDENDQIEDSLGSFVPGPNTPPAGTSSVEISVTGSQRRNLATYQFSQTLLSDITELKFSTYNPSAGNGGAADRSAYLNFNVDFDQSDTWQRRLIFLPGNNGTIAQDTWQQWNAIQSGNALWTYSGPLWPTAPAGPHMGIANEPGSSPRRWADIIADYPGVRLRATDSWLGLRVGEPYADGYTENMDLFVFNTNAANKCYDFEQASLPTASIQGNVLIDRNGNGTIDGNDTQPLSGWTVYLDMNDNNVRNAGEPSRTTGTNGMYSFTNLAAGTYHVREVVKTDAGWVRTLPVLGEYEVVLGNGEAVTGKQFGNFKRGSIAGIKYNDKNGNGQRNSGENGLSNWTIRLLDTNGNVLASTTTNSTGNYKFSNLGPGTYRIREVQKSGWHQTTPNPADVPLTSGANVTGKNFGNKQN